jgi:hypothetical protein
LNVPCFELKHTIMQKTLLVLAITAIFASCTQPKGETAGNGKPTSNVDQLDSNDVVPLDTADAWIQNYHKALRANGQPEIGLSFMLDANVLRQYLTDNPDVAKLDVYLAKPNDTAMTVVYIPAVQVVQGDSVVYEEHPVTLPGLSGQYALDHVMPCPICADRIKIPGSSASQ